MTPPEPRERAWWHDAVFYRVHVRSFADSDGDGVGDLEGVRSRLGYLGLLGVDALALTPFYLSPAAAGGFDVAGPRTVDPVLGNLELFEELVADAHASGLRIVLDLVPNHTSERHPWFTDALGAEPGSAERDRYHFRDGRGADGAEPPNNWGGVAGGPAWTRTADGHWSLQLFGPGLPDLNWANPEVQADFERTLRFWLDRRVDGFRLNAAHGMAKPDGLPDREPGGPDPRFDDDAVHQIHQRIRKVLDEYPGSVAIGEIDVSDEHRYARYLRSDELQLGLDGSLGRARFDADALQAAAERSLAVAGGADAPPCWAATGRARAPARALVELALPGACWLEQGQEIGIGDPGYAMPWEDVDGLLADPDSTLSLYRRALVSRREHPALAGDAIGWYGAPPGCFAFRREPGGLVCALNTSAAPVPLPPGEVLLSSTPPVDGRLPAGAAAWLTGDRARSAAGSGR